MNATTVDRRSRSDERTTRRRDDATTTTCDTKDEGVRAQRALLYYMQDASTVSIHRSYRQSWILIARVR